MALNLQNIGEKVGANHRVQLTTPMVLVFDYSGHEVSLFSKGRMLIKNVRDEDEALEVFRAVSKIVGMG